jgi:glycosyltransferase involved in cell wall biosynthesis
MVFPRFASEGYDVTLLGVRMHIKSDEYKGLRLRAIRTVKFAQTEKLIYHFLCFLYAAWARPKLVHLQGLNSALFLALYKLAGLKVVIRYGSADHEHGKWGLVGRSAFRLCERQLKYADHVIAVSHHYKATLRQRYGLQNVTVIPNGTDACSASDEATAFWRALDLGDKAYVLAVGRLTVDKDYETLVRAINMVSAQDVRLVVAGGADEAGYAERLFLMQNDRIRFLGHVDRRLLASIYRNCAVYVSCSQHEGLSNALLEAISHERPIVASDIPANREVPLQAGSYFPVGDATALARKIEAALAQPQSFLAARNRLVDWDHVFVDTETVYRRVVPALTAREYREASAR